MKFLRLLLVVLTIPTAAAATATVAGAAAPAPPPRASLTQFSCVRALDPDNRSVSVRAVMRPLAGTRRMAIKFDLLEQTAGSAPEALGKVGGLGVWITPTNPTLGQLSGDVWRLSKPVINLEAPAGYQFRVTFRWNGSHGRILGTAVRLSRTCHQPELRPDLLVDTISVTAISGQPEQDLYSAVIADEGATGAGPFEVLFAPGDTSAPITDTVQFLGAHKTRQLSFVGPVCNPSNPPTITVDAASQVDDYNRANNVMSAECPLPTNSQGAARRR